MEGDKAAREHRRKKWEQHRKKEVAAKNEAAQAEFQRKGRMYGHNVPHTPL